MGTTGQVRLDGPLDEPDRRGSAAQQQRPERAPASPDPTSSSRDSCVGTSDRWVTPSSARARPDRVGIEPVVDGQPRPGEQRPEHHAQPRHMGQGQRGQPVVGRPDCPGTCSRPRRSPAALPCVRTTPRGAEVVPDVWTTAPGASPGRANQWLARCAGAIGGAEMSIVRSGPGAPSSSGSRARGVCGVVGQHRYPAARPAVGASRARQSPIERHQDATRQPHGMDGDHRPRPIVGEQRRRASPARCRVSMPTHRRPRSSSDQVEADRRIGQRRRIRPARGRGPQRVDHARRHPEARAVSRVTRPSTHRRQALGDGSPSARSCRSPDRAPDRPARWPPRGAPQRGRRPVSYRVEMVTGTPASVAASTMRTRRATGHRRGPA